MITILEERPRGKTTLSRHIKDGTTFHGRIGVHPNRLFFKVYGNMIALDHNATGQAIWTSKDCEVFEYVPVDIEIRIV